MGKSLPFDKHAPIPNGITSIIGVFFTAGILFFFSVLYPKNSLDISHSYGVFTAVCAIYFFDHFLDFKIIFGTHDFFTRLNKYFAIIFAVFTIVFVVLFWRVYFLNIQYYLGAAGIVLYSLLYRIKKPIFRFFKEWVIALTAAWTVCIKPAASIDYGAWVVLGLLFFQNVILYSYLERELDGYWGFKSSFNTKHYSSNKYTLMGIQILCFMALNFVLYYQPLFLKIEFVSLAYVLLTFFVGNYYLKKYYRFVIDALLLGLFIP